MSGPFRHQAQARWGDMDFNGHMANVAYLNFGADSRLAYFLSRGFSLREFERLHFGPVVFKDELSYFKEIRLMEPVEVTLACAGLSPDGGRFSLRNEFFNGQGDRCATLLTSGAWLDLEVRKLLAPPPALVEAMRAMPRTGDYAELAGR
ncbi:MAG TPA: acyl-CoA thioesterase [Holophagaceae bacterium]|nr:acyl-CoA thioesterase [Holophagaceae bacterium]